MKKTIKARLYDLENRDGKPPIKPIYQDLDDPNIWYESNQRSGGHGKPMTWDQVENKYPDHMIIKVVYTDDWRADEVKNEKDN